MQMEEYYIYTQGMAVGYGKKPLITQIELRLRRGEILTLIGPNGAGKSTILKSMTKQLALLGGTVYLDGRSMDSMPDKERAKRLAVVMTERLRPELMTCEEVVATGRYPYTGTLGILDKQDKKKVQEAMELVHARELADRDFMEISDGQRQRILLARAICQEPEAIVLDEPTSFLDIRHKLELLTILKEMVRKERLAVVMSLHELDLAQRVSDQVVCVHGNVIEKYGSPEEIFTSAYIQSLYDMTKGSYNAQFGCLEMDGCAGPPEIFVIGGNGSGISVYRKLQRNHLPFAAGVIHENDVDYPVAKALACEVVSQQAFEPVGDQAYERAATLLCGCKKVLCPLKEFGSMNEGNRRLRELAKERGLLDGSFVGNGWESYDTFA